jgi:hypothetical protein
MGGLIDGRDEVTATGLRGAGYIAGDADAPQGIRLCIPSARSVDERASSALGENSEKISRRRLNKVLAYASRRKFLAKQVMGKGRGNAP